MTVTITAKSRTISNGDAGDATPVESNFVDLYGNDANLKTKVDNLLNGKVEDATSLIVNSNYAGSTPGNMSVLFERGTDANTGIRWNDTDERIEVTHDGTNWYPVALALSADPESPTAGSIWYNTTDKDFRYSNGISIGNVGLPSGYIDGLQLSNNTTDANNDIDIAAGTARDASNTIDLVLESALTKRLDAAWAEGTNEGGLDTGSKANSTVYHLFLILNPTDGIVDVLFSASRTSPTMPTGYTLKRRIGAIRTNSSGNITAEVRSGLGRRRYVAYQTPSLDIISAASTTRANATVSVPDGDRYTIRAIANNTGGGNTVYFSNPELTDLAAIAISTALTAGTNMYGQLVDVGGVSEVDMGTPLEVTTNLNRQISFRCAVTGTTIRFITLGYWEEL